MVGVFLTLFYFPAIHAESADIYPFSTSAQQQQFQGLISQLRCLVCQNQDLADSNADLAKDLRRQVYDMVLDHKNDAQIKQYLTTRYGDFILFKPAFNTETLALWLMPLCLLFIGGIIWWRLAYLRNLRFPSTRCK